MTPLYSREHRADHLVPVMNRYESTAPRGVRCSLQLTSWPAGDDHDSSFPAEDRRDGTERPTGR
jgi:hypothetical protein